MIAPFLLFFAPALTEHQQLARDIFKELIEINTTQSIGDNTRAARAMADRFLSAGFPESDIHVLEPVPRKGNLVVRLRGTGAARPILFIGHLDVVEALRSDWSFDPFTFREQDGYFYGRGAQDMKGDDAIFVADFIRLKREGFRPSRDLILALTADEESGPVNGIAWLVEKHRPLIDAAFCINADSGGGSLRRGVPQSFSIQAAEKTIVTFQLQSTGPGGHSSAPRKDNPIYDIATALHKLSQFEFPIRLNEITRASIARRAANLQDERAPDFKALLSDPPDPAAAARLSATPGINAQLRTTCVATQLAAGHATNALPQTATAVVNCRIIPGETAELVETTLTRLFANPSIKITTLIPATVSPVSPVHPKLLEAIQQLVNEKHPGTPVGPIMEIGATDGKYLRLAGIPTYGISGGFGEAGDSRAHGRDERMNVQSFFDSLDFMYRIIKTLATRTEP